MLYNFNILTGMDVSYAVDCGYACLHVATLTSCRFATVICKFCKTVQYNTFVTCTQRDGNSPIYCILLVFHVACIEAAIHSYLLYRHRKI